MKILVLPGDGIGPEIVAATIDVLARADALFSLGFAYEYADIGFAALKATGTTFPSQVLEAARAADGVVLGPVSHNAYPPVAEGGLNPSGELRKRLDLYANIRPSRTRDNLPSPSRHPFDIVVVRENTEGFYADRNMFEGGGEYRPTPDVAIATRKITRQASERIARTAFELATTRRKKVCVVHKANVLRMSDGLFLEAVRSVARDYPDVQVEEQLIDAMAALLVRNAGPYDVIVTTNMFGDILSDEISELSGSLGLGGSINAGSHHCVAQAQHGSAPGIAGKNLANPTSLILSAAMMLHWLGQKRGVDALRTAGARIEAAVEAVLADPATRTSDLGGNLGTDAYAASVIAALERSAK